MRQGVIWLYLYVIFLKLFIGWVLVPLYSRADGFDMFVDFNEASNLGGWRGQGQGISFYVLMG